jgi:acetylornithine deacetylase
MTGSPADAIMRECDARRDEAVELLRTLVRIPSVTGDEGEIQHFLAGTLRELGLELDVWESDWEKLKRDPGYVPVTRGYEGRPNIVATLKGSGGGGRSLLLNGHTDTVPPGPAEAWSHDPYDAAIADERLYGRGASDMKSGVAAMVMALRCLVGAGIRLEGDVFLNLVVDEELSGHGTLDTLLRGYRADAAICAETSGNAVQPACIGRIWFEIRIAGKAAGIQRRYLGVNAIDLGYKVVQAVGELEQQRLRTLSHPLYPKLIDSVPCMVGTIAAGSFPSAFPDSCVLTGSIATLPNEDHDAVKQSLVDQIARVAAADGWLFDHPPEIAFVGYDARAAEIAADHPIIGTVASSFEEVTGRAPEISGRQGAADTRFLIAAGIPTAIFGPGSTAQMHANDEWVSVRDLHDATKTIALAVARWCGTAGAM